MFEGFQLSMIDTGEAVLRVRMALDEADYGRKKIMAPESNSLCRFVVNLL